MHPLMASGRRLTLYLVAWVPIAGLLVSMTSASGIPWQKASLSIGPACLVFAFGCLSWWYLCKAWPLRLGELGRLLPNLLIAATSGGLLLAGCAQLAAWALKAPPPLFRLLFGAGVLLYLLSAGVHYAALGAESSRLAEMQAAEARTLAREAELSALKLQLNPHFLFNSLHSIAALATLDGGRAREMCIKLADFLRGSLKLSGRESIPLHEELALAQRYLDVEQVRFGERLRVEAEVEPGCQDCAVPALLLQPLVENAVKHGIAGLVEGGAIKLFARREGSAVAITVENAFDPEVSASSRLGLGLPHVRRRLQVRYGEEAHFRAGAHDGVYQVELRLPCEPSIASISRA